MGSVQYAIGEGATAATHEAGSNATSNSEAIVEAAIAGLIGSVGGMVGEATGLKECVKMIRKTFAYKGNIRSLCGPQY